MDSCLCGNDGGEYFELCNSLQEMVLQNLKNTIFDTICLVPMLPRGNAERSWMLRRN